MIRFCCEQCGHKIGVEDGQEGKRGRCPACSAIFVVPAESTVIDFNCASCGRVLSALKIHAGRKIICSLCQSTLVVPAGSDALAQAVGVVRFACSMCHQEIEEPDDSRGKLIECPHCKEYVPVPIRERPVQEAAISTVPGAERDTSDRQFEQLQGSIGGEMRAKAPAPTTERMLPWILDVFLYPISKPGLAILGIAVVVRVIFRIVVRFLGIASGVFPPFLAFFGFMWAVGMLVRIILILYVWWYLCECVRESAAGVVRAPEITGRTPGLGEIFWQAFMTSGCLLFFAGPPFFYHAETKAADPVFWGLVVYAVLFFPMSLLAVVEFESWCGLNPILLGRSILSTFLPYCGLMAAIAALAAAGVFIVRQAPDPRESSLGLFVFWCTSIYLAMIAAHLMGSFYRRYDEKLNWGV